MKFSYIVVFHVSLNLGGATFTLSFWPFATLVIYLSLCWCVIRRNVSTTRSDNCRNESEIKTKYRPTQNNVTITKLGVLNAVTLSLLYSGMYGLVGYRRFGDPRRSMKRKVKSGTILHFSCSCSPWRHHRVSQFQFPPEGINGTSFVTAAGSVRDPLFNPATKVSWPFLCALSIWIGQSINLHIQPWRWSQQNYNVLKSLRLQSSMTKIRQTKPEFAAILLHCSILFWLLSLFRLSCAHAWPRTDCRTPVHESHL
jgi:hypothetical protein